MKKLILFSLPFSILSCETQDHKPDLAVEKLQTENNRLIQQMDSLNKESDEVRLSENYWFDDQNEGADFVNQGIKNPEKSIENALREKPELIPLEPVLGGNMRFGNIQILSDKWVIAEFDDGHVTGRSIYRYKLNTNKTFEFELLDSKLPE